MDDLSALRHELKKEENPVQAKLLQRFFKTGKGEYGEGDIFLGIKVPVQRSIAKKHIGLSLPKLQELLESKIHEERLVSLLILVEKFKKSTELDKANIFNFYIKNSKRVNNWDLVDLSSHCIVGEFLIDKDKKILYNLAESSNLWEKRISIISTFAFIRKNKFDDALRLAQILLKDKHDLIHKVVGWMLREIGKKDQETLEKFLEKNYKEMPRTMLRYAIEKFPEDKRKTYLKGEI